MQNQSSYYDSLAVCKRLEDILESASSSEVHLFAYLACLLSVYKGQTVSDWGYSFGVTANGYPFSAAIDQSIELLLNNSFLLREEDGLMRLSARGVEELEWLETLSIGQERERFVAGACDSALSLPVGLIRGALNNSVGIKSAIAHSHSAKLIPSSPALTLLHDQFEALSEAVGVSVQDLMIPATVWLRFLSVSISEH